MPASTGRTCSSCCRPSGAPAKTATTPSNRSCWRPARPATRRFATVRTSRCWKTSPPSSPSSIATRPLPPSSTSSPSWTNVRFSEEKVRSLLGNRKAFESLSRGTFRGAVLLLHSGEQVPGTIRPEEDPLPAARVGKIEEGRLTVQGLLERARRCRPGERPLQPPARATSRSGSAFSTPATIPGPSRRPCWPRWPRNCATKASSGR